MLLNASFRFYEELNDFLPKDKQKLSFKHYFAKGATVKDIIESLGIPHTEIDLILVNSKSVDFAYQVQNDDYVSVYPMFELLDIHPVIRLRPEPLREPRFITDDHLQKLTKYLRLLGFDTVFANGFSDDQVIALSKQEQRIILTRDLHLLKRKAVTHGSFVKSINPKLQIAEVLFRFDLMRKCAPFTRCLACNGYIEKIADIRQYAKQIPKRVLESQEDFYQCSQCHRIYWQGTHYQALNALVQQWLT